MPSGENVSNNNNETVDNSNGFNSEAYGNRIRELNRRRGEMVTKAEREKEIEDIRKELEKKKKRLEELKALKRGHAEASGSQDDQTNPQDLDPSSDQQPTQAETDNNPSSDAAPESNPDTPAESSDDATSESNPDAAQVPTPEKEPVSEETASEIKDKIKKRSGFKKYIISAAAIGLAAWMAISSGLAGRNKKETPPVDNSPAIETNVGGSEADVSDQAENQEVKNGIKDGYGEKGMWLSDNKPNAVAFASAVEVAEECGNNENEMIKYTAENQVESFADYMANLPEQLQPDEFKGLSILETEKKLESLSESEFEAMQQRFNVIMTRAQVRHIKLEKGNYTNAYMQKKNKDAAVDHENMELVECTTYEDGIEVAQFVWFDDDGNEIGTMTVKIIYDEEDKIKDGCNQVINVEGKKVHLYAEMVSISDTSINFISEISGGGNGGGGGGGNSGGGGGSNPGPGTDNPHPHKDPNAERRGAGNEVNQMTADPSQANSESSHESQESTNRASVNQQAAADDAARQAAAQQQEAQAGAERQAAKEAEQRRQQEAQAGAERQAQADAARKAAEQQQAEAQRKANEAAAAAQAEQRRQQEAQAEAESRAQATNAPAADSANDFANQAAGL